MRRVLPGLLLVVFLVGVGSAATEVRPLDLRQVQPLLRGYRGDVVLVNFWATWCVPCDQEMADLVTLQSKYGRKGVQVVGISTDEAAQLQSAVVPFLARHQVNYPVFLESGEASAFMRWFSPTWVGQLPTTFVFDRHGQRVHELHGRQTLSQFEEVVVPLL
ncbi:MAG: TlpA family protein disulfide reductase [Candidatus Xenobia bacterium]